jgi:hypothetical protein
MAESHTPIERMTLRCTTVTGQAMLAFEKVEYNLHKGMDIDNFIQSTRFSVDGYEWLICCYRRNRRK